MTNEHIVLILKESALALKHGVDPSDLRSVVNNQRSYEASDLAEFKRDLIEAAREIDLLALEYSQSPHMIEAFLREAKEPILFFKLSDEGISPLLLQWKKGKVVVLVGEPNENDIDLASTKGWFATESGELLCMVLMPYKGIVSEQTSDEDGGLWMSPVKRLVRLLSTERKEIYYIFLYALIVGMVSLILPLGLQTTVELISGGVFFSSVYILIALVIIGVAVTGGLQIVQISLVEHLQRRVFTKAAFEFAYRIPRLRMEALMKSYAPELVNRFFDVIILQKGLPKLLIDLSSGIIQILFGLLLLSLYHPFFVFFSLFLLMILALIFYVTSAKGLSTAISESKYKYKVVQWLEELARAMNSFKLAGDTDLPSKRTDYAVSNYLKYRKAHFGVLIKQFSLFVFFKVAVTGSLLVMGTILVINREITLGQFVAAEVIIILVLNAVEKIIMYLDVIYDLLAAVDKVSNVTDLPLEKTGGFDFPKKYAGKGYGISIRQLKYSYEGKSKLALAGIDLQIKPFEKVCIAGPGGSGKTTLTNIIAGLYSNYEGGVAINSFSLKDLDIGHLRNKVAKNISQEDIFDGTIYENIRMGKSGTTVEAVMDALENVGLKDIVASMPDGLNTHIVSGGKGLSSSVIHRLILARCLAKKPELIILNDFFSGLMKSDKLQLVGSLISEKSTWTLVAVSNDPLIMAACDRVVVMDEGKIIADNNYHELLKQGLINQYFE